MNPLPTQKELQETFQYVDGLLVYRKSGKTAGTLSKGRLVVKFKGKLYFVYRLIWKLLKGYDPQWLDHINRDPNDNRIENLREATQSQNSANKTSTGVYKRRNQYEAFIKDNGVLRYLGLYPTWDEAHKVFQQEHIKLHGEFSPYFAV